MCTKFDGCNVKRIALEGRGPKVELGVWEEELANVEELAVGARRPGGAPGHRRQTRPLQPVGKLSGNLLPPRGPKPPQTRHTLPKHIYKPPYKYPCNIYPPGYPALYHTPINYTY